jgi:hypothetical protein
VVSAEAALTAAREEAALVRLRAAHNERVFHTSTQEINRLTGALESRQREVADLEARLAEQEREMLALKRSLTQTQAQTLLDGRELAQLRPLRARHEAAELRAARLDALLASERDKAAQALLRAQELVEERLGLKEEAGQYRVKYQAQIQIRDELQGKVRALTTQIRLLASASAAFTGAGALAAAAATGPGSPEPSPGAGLSLDVSGLLSPTGSAAPVTTGSLTGVAPTPRRGGQTRTGAATSAPPPLAVAVATASESDELAVSFTASASGGLPGGSSGGVPGAGGAPGSSVTAPVAFAAAPYVASTPRGAGVFTFAQSRQPSATTPRPPSASPAGGVLLLARGLSAGGTIGSLSPRGFFPSATASAASAAAAAAAALGGGPPSGGDSCDFRAGLTVNPNAAPVAHSRPGTAGSTAGGAGTAPSLASLAPPTPASAAGTLSGFSSVAGTLAAAQPWPGLPQWQQLTPELSLVSAAVATPPLPRGNSGSFGDDAPQQLSPLQASPGRTARQPSSPDRARAGSPTHGPRALRAARAAASPRAAPASPTAGAAAAAGALPLLSGPGGRSFELDAEESGASGSPPLPKGSLSSHAFTSLS